MNEYIYTNTELIRVVDGDTIDVIISIDVGFDIVTSHKLRLRVRNLDTPETWRPKTELEKEHGLIATQKAKELLSKPFTIKTYKKGKYGRYEADIILDNNVDYAETMKSFGLEKKSSYDSIT